MEKLHNSLRKHLKRQAHHLEPVIFIGKNGITEGTIHSIRTALETKELIKIKFHNFKDEKLEISEKIATKTQSLVVWIVGNTLILFKENTDTEKQKYRLT